MLDSGINQLAITYKLEQKLGQLQVYACLRVLFVSEASNTTFKSLLYSMSAPVPGHGLTPEQYEACMKASDRWHKAASDEGWVLAHNALRLEMDEFAAALAALAGQAINKWQVNIARKRNNV